MAPLKHVGNRAFGDSWLGFLIGHRDSLASNDTAKAATEARP
jgi:hypothetical protein